MSIVISSFFLIGVWYAYGTLFMAMILSVVAIAFFMTQTGANPTLKWAVIAAVCDNMVGFAAVVAPTV